MQKIDEMIKTAFGTSFGLGYMPLVPGSFGTLPAVAIYIVIGVWVPPEIQTAVIGLCLLIVCGMTLQWSAWAIKRFKDKDPKQFVIDEWAGFLTTVMLVRMESVLETAVGAFLLVRLIDPLKIPPAKQMEEDLPGGWGILLDDICSGLYAAGVLCLVNYFF